MFVKSLIKGYIISILLCMAVPASAASMIYLGVFVNDKAKDLGDFSGVEQFEQDAGKNVAIIHVFQAWGAPDGKNQFDPAAMTAIREHGSIPLLTWAPRRLHRNENQPAFALRNIIEGKFDDYITKYALDIRNWGHPLFLRFAHEMNGTWYPWSEKVNGNHPGEYVKAWRHVHNIFTRNQVTNVTWVWCPSRKFINPRKLRELYPGDRYVDWMGMDGYNDTRNSAWESLAQIFGGLYGELTAMSSKPIMIAEFASLEKGGNKAQWITRALDQTVPDRLPHVYAIVWLNHKFGNDLDWRIESSPAAQEAFKEAVDSPIYLGNGFDSIDNSPIPAP